MTCSEFLERYSDFFDAADGTPEAQAFVDHMASCARCRRYHDVVRRGVDLLRAMPGLEVPESFGPRLEHRLLHERDAAVLRQAGPTSGATVATVVGVAALIAVAAWSPLLQRELPEVEVSPIVVSRPASYEPLPPLELFNPVGFSTLERRPDVWDDPAALLYEYSPISAKYRARGQLRRTGFD
ncbi:MAG: hypothetical protein D6701_13595 [Gemmatimonadetes bacterium]|nr:MAG: hypothetical protein D6701_13595 [Gemmatimonadota bacterium]